jgi:protein-arginine kinase activator protein McsA
VANDDEAERAVERWVSMGDELVAGKMGGQRARSPRACAECGMTFNTIATDDRALCAGCFLERGTTRTRE